MPIISAAIAAIGPLLGSLGTFVAGLQATKIGAFLIETLSYVATNLLVQAILGKPKPPAFSLRTTLRAGEDTPRSFVVGRTMTAGSLVYANTYTGSSGTVNAWLVNVIALSDLPIAGLHKVFVNSEEVTLGALDPDKGYAVNEYNGKMFIKFYDGTQTAADAYLVSELGADPYRPYGSAHIGYGVAYAICHCLVDQELFSGFPQFRFVVDGVPLYDPSRDDTAGGSGAQRWDTPATWGGDGDELPVVQAYNLMRGITYGGEWLYGLQGISEFQLSPVEWIAEIEKCRAQINENSGLVPTFRCAAEIEVSAEIGTTIEGIMASCAGRIAEAGGTFKPLAGPVGSSVKSFTDDDILATSDQSFVPFPGLSDSVNGITCQYPEPDEAYSLKTAPPLYDDDHETQDGGYRLLSRVTLPNVPYGEQVQRLMAWSLAEARKQRRHTIVMPPEWHPIEANDAITWTSLRNGYSNKLFRVEGSVILADGDVVLDIRECDPADYSWNTATDFTQVNTSPIATVRPPAQAVVGFGVAAVAIQDGTPITRRVGLKFTWSTVGIEGVEGIRFEIRNKMTQVVVSRPETLNFAAGELTTESGLIANTTYECRAIYTSFSGRILEWTAWSEITTTITISLPGVPSIQEQLYATRDGTSVRVLLAVSWAASPEATAYQLEARLALDKDGNATGNPFITFGRTDQQQSEIRDVSPGSWEVRVKGYNQNGAQSGYSTSSKIIYGLSVPPEQLTGVKIQQAGGLAALRWDLSPDLDVRIGGRVIIRHSESTVPNWSNSVSFDEVDGNTSAVAVPLKPGTYLLRAIDSSGIYGPVSTVTTQGIQATPFINSDTLTADPTWSGTKTNTEVDTGALKLTDNTIPGTYEFATGFDLGVVKNVRVRSVIDVAAVNLASNIDDRTENIDLWADFDDSEGAEIDVIVEMRMTNDDPTGSPTWSDWFRVDSTEVQFWGAEFRATLSSSNPDFNILLSGLSVAADEVA